MKTKILSAVALAGLIITAAPVDAADYVIDTKGQHASINFRVKHLGYSWLTGRFDKFSGTFNFDDKAPDASKVKVEIDTASVNSNHAERDKHLRSDDFLNVAAHPKATFESTSVKLSGEGKATIIGKLTLNGVTKDVTIDAERIGGGADPWGGHREGFSGKTKIALSDFAIKKDLGPAAKDVELTLEVEGVRQ
ncbi:MAG: YceI family protein [Hyphomicrobium sp.]